MLNMEEIATLFHIHEKAMAHGTVFANIRDAAWKALQAHDSKMAGPAPASTYVPTALDKELAGTAAAEPPPTAEPKPEVDRGGL